LAILAIGSAAQATPILYDGFNYTPIAYTPSGSSTTTASLATNATTGTNWTFYEGHFSNSHETAAVISGGLSFTGMTTTSTGALQCTVPNNPTFAGYQNIFQLPLSSNTLPANGSTMWVSYMWQANSGVFYTNSTAQATAGFLTSNTAGDPGTYGQSYRADILGPFSAPPSDGGTAVAGPGVGYGLVQVGATNSKGTYATGTAIPTTYNTTYMAVIQITNVNPTTGSPTETEWILNQANYTALLALDGGNFTPADLNANCLQSASETDNYYLKTLTASSYIQLSTVANFVSGMPTVEDTFGQIAIGTTGADVSDYTATTPEPATIGLLVLGGIGALLRRRK
jgi:hypothetical protein